MQFDFIADRQNNTITIRREFAASRQLVWDAYTKPELLDQWFAPRPLTTKTAHMDFSEGGYWLFAMIEPSGKEHWSRQDYISIDPIDSYTAKDAFSDETGAINEDYPTSHLVTSFRDQGTSTIVESVVKYDSLNDLEAVIKMGMEEGYKSTVDRLDELLEKLTTD